ncbi:checkpoint protein Hus1/Mec3 [Aspergillus desertorum]
MRFRTQVVNTATLTKLIGSLSSLGKLCWMRLEESVVRFTIIPDQGTQVWAQLPVESIFEDTNYILESNTGVINLEVPLSALHRALRSAAGAKWVQLRLTKKGKVPLLALTIRTKGWTKEVNPLGIGSGNDSMPALPSEEAGTRAGADADAGAGLMGPPAAPAAVQGTAGTGRRERETFITQEVPVKVMHESAVEGLHEPRCRDPDVHIILPDLFQLKSISERFTKLASDSTPKAAAVAATTSTTAEAMLGSAIVGVSPKLELSANMHGSLRLAIATDTLRISSVWSDLVNPALDPSQLSQSQMDQLPSERMRALPGDDEAAWAKVRIDGRDWARVLSVGRLNPKVVACFIHETALVLYVYPPSGYDEEGSCLTYYINSYMN